MTEDDILRILNAFRRNIGRIYTQFQNTLTDQDIQMKDYFRILSPIKTFRRKITRRKRPRRRKEKKT